MSRYLFLICIALLAMASLGSAQVINEFLYDTRGTDDPGIMFVEIWAQPGTNLDDWTLVGVNGNGGEEYLTVELSGDVPADGYMVVGGSNVANVDMIVTADFQNAGSSTGGEDCDGLDLRNSQGQTIDHLCYGNCAAGHVCNGEGGSNAPDYNPPSSGPEKSLARIPDHQDTNDNGADFVLSDPPTPGVANSGTPCSPHDVTLSDIRENNGQGVSVLKDTFVVVSGIVNVDNHVFDDTTSSFYMQDEDAGVNVFGGAVPAGIVAGDNITVSAWVNQYNGLTELVGSGPGNCFFEVEVTGHTNPPSPALLTTGSFFEAFEGMLGQINNLTIVSGSWPSQGQFANIVVTDGDGTIILRIDDDTNIDGSPAPTQPFNVVGIITQFDSSPPYNDPTSYQITPRTTSDIFTLAADDPHEIGNVKDFRLLGAYPNPFNSVTQIRYEVGSTRDLTLRIFDLLGREVSTEKLTGLTPGTHTYAWTATGSTGLYFIRMEGAGTVQTAKMLYLK